MSQQRRLTDPLLTHLASPQTAREKVKEADDIARRYWKVRDDAKALVSPAGRGDPLACLAALLTSTHPTCCCTAPYWPCSAANVQSCCTMPALR